MQFSPLHTGPFYLTETKNEIQIWCRRGNNKKYTCTQLFKTFEANPATQNLCPAMSLQYLRQLAQQHNMPIEYQETKKIEGWCLKPKGMLHILWERGFIDPQKTNRQIWNEFNVDHKKDAEDNNIAGTSLKEMIGNLPDFKNEMTLLKFHASKLQVQLRCSPKYHPKIAGEAIEFCLALTKNTYRQYKLSDKKKNKREIF